MNNHLTYFLILGASLLVPLSLSFDKKVSFYKKWKYLFTALILPVVIYIAWDVWFTSKGVWQFNEKYVTGAYLLNLPVEEVLFFIIVPYCCVFIYECVVSWFPKIIPTRYSDILFTLLGAALVITGAFFNSRMYTAVTFILCGTGILFIRFFPPLFKYFNTRAFLISYLIIFIPFVIVNGFLTAIPVVIYNDYENLGLRLYTIPIEDLFYGFLLIVLTVAIYEKLIKRNSTHGK